MYLREMKQNCKEKAEAIKDWRKLSRSELCLKYLEEKEKNPYIADAYMSALLYSYWNVITYNYLHQASKIATPEDCYNFIVDGIVYALNQKAWTIPSSSLYNDPKGPEKAINKVLDCRKINFFVASTRNNRHANFVSLSLNELEDEHNSAGFYTQDASNVKTPNVKLDKYVKTLFNHKEYLPAFMVDAIMNNEFAVHTKEKGKMYSSFDYSALKSYLRNMSDVNCAYFAKKYNIPYDEVISSSKYLTSETQPAISRKVDTALKHLSHDRTFMEYLK